jgi:hypothetical protein
MLEGGAGKENKGVMGTVHTFFFFAILGFELRALLGKHCSIWPPSLFALVCFSCSVAGRRPEKTQTGSREEGMA